MAWHLAPGRDILGATLKSFSPFRGEKELGGGWVFAGIGCRPGIPPHPRLSAPGGGERVGKGTISTLFPSHQSALTLDRKEPDDHPRSGLNRALSKASICPSKRVPRGAPCFVIRGAPQDRLRRWSIGRRGPRQRGRTVAVSARPSRGGRGIRVHAISRPHLVRLQRAHPACRHASFEGPDLP